MPLWCGNFICRIVRILVLPSGSVSLLMLSMDFDLEVVENDFLTKSVLSWWSQKELVPWRLSCWSPWGSALSPWRSSKWSWKGTDSMLWALLVTDLLLDLEWRGLPLPLCPLDVLQDFLFPAPDCLDLQHVLKWFLFPHLWHFLPHAGHSLGGWDVPHLLHVLPWLPLVLWPWPFLCLKVLISSMVVAVATPLLDLCWLKSLMVASCCLACAVAVCWMWLFCSVLSAIWPTSWPWKCFVAWKIISSWHFFFSSSDE